MIIGQGGGGLWRLRRWRSAAVGVGRGGGRRQWVAAGGRNQPKTGQNRGYRGGGSRATRGEEEQAPASFAATAASR